MTRGPEVLVGGIPPYASESGGFASDPRYLETDKQFGSRQLFVDNYHLGTVADNQSPLVGRPFSDTVTAQSGLFADLNSHARDGNYADGSLILSYYHRPDKYAPQKDFVAGGDIYDHYQMPTSTNLSGIFFLVNGLYDKDYNLGSRNFVVIILIPFILMQNHC